VAAKNELDSGAATLAKEVNVFVVTVLGGEGGAAVPALVVPSCQREDFEFVNVCIETLLRVAKAELAPHFVVATGCDGASNARKAEKVRLKYTLSESLKVYLPHCTGLDLRVAQDDIVQSPDTNHAAIKRVASWLRRLAGIYIDGYTVYPSFLESIVASYETRARLNAGGVDAAPLYLPAAPATATGDFIMFTPEVMRSLLVTSDAMSTEYALKLLRAVSLLDKAFAPRLAQMRRRRARGAHCGACARGHQPVAAQGLGGGQGARHPHCCWGGEPNHCPGALSFTPRDCRGARGHNAPGRVVAGGRSDPASASRSGA